MIANVSESHHVMLTVSALSQLSYVCSITDIEHSLSINITSYIININI